MLCPHRISCNSVSPQLLDDLCELLERCDDEILPGCAYKGKAVSLGEKTDGLLERIRGLVAPPPAEEA